MFHLRELNQARLEPWAAIAALIVSGCALPPGMDSSRAISPSVFIELPPPGYGTLHQDEVSILLTSGKLQILVTPLHESVTRVTAPDTYERLSSIAKMHQREAPEGEPQLFLVSFFTDEPAVPFVPEEVQFVSRGLRLRSSTITPVTPRWGEHRLRQRETEMAVYSFRGLVDLESNLTLVYGLEQTDAWSMILSRVQTERARARARARRKP